MDFSKTKVSVASVNHSKLDVSSTHITTGNFMQLMPVYYRHMIPGEHIKGNGSVLARLAPVSVPSYGRCRINMRSFFVPFRTIFPKFNEFITDTIASNATGSSLVASSPIVTNSVLLNWFMTKSIVVGGNTILENVRLLDATDADDAAIINQDMYDIKVSTSYYVFTTRGRERYKWLCSLGYRIVWDDKNTEPFSALPILAFAKCYLDWYANSAYLNNQLYYRVQQLLEFNTPSANLQLTATHLTYIFDLIRYLSYDSSNDVFLNAWDNPMSPNNGLSTNLAISDITSSYTNNGNTYSSGVVDMGNPGFDQNTPIMLQRANTGVYIGSQYLHTALKSLTDYVKRNQLSGAYAVDRFLARFGINLDSAKVNRSIYVSSTSVDVDFGQVTQVVNTAQGSDPSNLGSYGGIGIGNGNLDFDYKCDEFGIFLVLYSIIPAAHFFQGYDRNLKHILKTQFFTPEYDNLGCQGIEKGEVYVSKNSTFGTDYSGVYGFAPRYYEYKQKTDFVTGDFTYPTAMAGGDAWHLQRIFKDDSFGTAVTDIQHSFELTQGVDAGQYDRIFNYTDTDIDKFYLVFNFNAQALAPCKSLFDTYDFDEMFRQLTMDAGGAKVN